MRIFLSHTPSPRSPRFSLSLFPTPPLSDRSLPLPPHLYSPSPSLALSPTLHPSLAGARSAGGTLLLLALSNQHDPQGACAIGLVSTSALTVILSMLVDLGGGLEGATRLSLCPREVQGPPPLDMGVGGWGSEGHSGGWDATWGWGCLPPLEWYCPLVAVAFLSMTPVYILTSVPVLRPTRRERGRTQRGWSGGALEGLVNMSGSRREEDEEDFLLSEDEAGEREREARYSRQWGGVGYLLQLGRAGVRIVCGEDQENWEV
jgi:hypothetical protein